MELTRLHYYFKTPAGLWKTHIRGVLGRTSRGGADVGSGQKSDQMCHRLRPQDAEDDDLDGDDDDDISS